MIIRVDPDAADACQVKEEEENDGNKWRTDTDSINATSLSLIGWNDQFE